MTTNAGAREMEQAPVGFCSTSSASDRSAGAVEQTFSPEFRNRLDAMIPFNSLSRDLMGRIVDKTMAALEPGLAAPSRVAHPDRGGEKLAGRSRF